MIPATLAKYARYAVISMVLGGTTEVVSIVMKWVAFSPYFYIPFHVVVLEGAGFGALAWWLRSKPLWVPALVGGLGGSVLEALNQSILHLWCFPEGNLFGVASTAAMFAILALVWAPYLPLVILIARSAERSARHAESA